MAKNPSDHNVINYVEFNETGKKIALGTTKGFDIFNCDPFHKCFTQSIGSTKIICMIKSTSLISLVGMGEEPNMSPRRLKLLNVKDKLETISDLMFPTSILRVKINSNRLTVFIKEKIYIYRLADMKLLHVIEGLDNPMGIGAITNSVDRDYLAYPNQTTHHTKTTGQIDPSKKKVKTDIILFDMTSLQPIMVIEAHKGNIAALAFSSDGTLLATASTLGTIVRVFNTNDGRRLYQFRRGTYPAKISGISYSPDNKFLAVASKSLTVHIFQLKSAEKVKPNELETPQMDDEEFVLLEPESSPEDYSLSDTSSIQNVIKQSSRIVTRKATRQFYKLFAENSTQHKNNIEPKRHVAFCKLPPIAKGTDKIVSFLPNSSTLLNVHIITSTGYHFKYQFDTSLTTASNIIECSFVNQNVLIT